MKIIIMIGIAVMLAGCMPTMTMGTHNEIQDHLERGRALHKQQSLLVLNNADPDEVLSLAYGMEQPASDILNICNNTTKVPTLYFSICASYIDYLYPIKAQMLVASANYYLQACNKDKAKAIYRDVILTYTGSNYKSIVKQAEFGLEDLKDRDCK